MTLPSPRFKNSHEPLSIRNGTSTIYIFPDRFRIQSDSGKISTFLFGRKIRNQMLRIFGLQRRAEGGVSR